jgi:hypothetical protein
MATLDISLNTTQRIKLVNQLFNQSVTYATRQLKSVEINMNTATPDSSKKKTVSVRQILFFPFV